MQRQQRRERRRPRDNAGGIALSEVHHGFGGTDVLEDVTLTLWPGETLAVIGLL
ncbi:hypothetical protein [Natronomonas sp. LN261]|jgi:ABC-type transporter Mla maintaining outer membrane lipid asymmetry ATPase subunit MlaF|uniref:hypothetical protein n=1 Tax=Natronomonas sp. LN261 TaxID=2750669 RepID=UPI0015EE88E7|nr:hypothetical protein [Natronomonas sp. LN261]